MGSAISGISSLGAPADTTSHPVFLLSCRQISVLPLPMWPATVTIWRDGILDLTRGEDAMHHLG